MADWRDAIPSVDEFVQRDTPLIPEQPKPAESGMTDWREAIPDAPGFESAPTPPKEMHRVVAQDTTPDTEAKIAQLSMRSRLPDALIRSDLRTAEAYDEYKRMRDATASTPATARFLSIAENMAAARDDAEALAEVEKSLLGFFGYNFRNTPAQIAKGNVAASYAFDPDNKDELNRYMLSLTGMEKAEFYKLRSELVAGGADPDRALAEAAKQRIGYHRDYWQSVAESESFAIPEQYQVPETFWEKVFAAGGGSAPGMLLTAINAPAGTAWFTQQIYGSEFDSYVKQGVAPERARDAALVSALMQIPLEYAGNVIQLKAVSKALKPGGVKDFLLNVTQGALSEGLVEYLQSYPQLFSSIYATNPDMSAGDALVEFIKQIPDESFQADALESAAVGAVLGGALPGIGGAAAAPFNYRSRREYKEVVEPVVAQQTAVQQSQAEQEALMQLREKVLATKTKTRNPRKAEEHIQGILDRSQDVPQEVYIPAARLVEVMDANPGIVAPLLEELELSQGEVAEAAAQGIDLAVSTAKYAAYAMGTDLDTALVNDLRLSPNSMTAAQLAEAEKTFTEDLARHTEALRRKDEARTVIEQERQQVYEDVKRQLVANNVKAPEENAVAMAAAFATMSQRYGNGSPLELYNAVGLNTRRFADLAAYDAAKKEGLAQDAPSIESVRTSWAGRGLDSFISERDGVINLSKFVVPEDQRGGGVGSAAMRELIAYADATGQRIALTPSKDFGGSSVKRLKGFYKRFGFVENKGRAKDPALSESMYREPAASPLAQTAAVAGADLNDPAQVEDAARLWREMGTESPYFKRWFGESKVVDENGAPLVVYHGTRAGDFDFFNTSGDGKIYGGEVGSHFGPENQANARLDQTRNRGVTDGEAVYPVYLNIRNPLRVEDRGGFSHSNIIMQMKEQGILDYAEWESLALGGPYDARDVLESKGYDGLVYSNKVEGQGEDTYVAFDPAQIKSVFNRGTFDESDPRTLNQAATAGADLNNPAELEEAARMWREMGTESPYFKRWFGDSKVVDEDGDGLKVFHWSPASDIRAFNVSSESGMIWFSESPSQFEDEGGSAYPVYLKIENPLDLSDAHDRYTPDVWARILEEAGVDTGELRLDSRLDPDEEIAFGYLVSNWDVTLNNDSNLAEVIQAGGFDGIKAPTEDYRDGGVNWVVFDPTQIKSVFNRGTFDPADPRMLMQGADSLGFFSPTAKAVEAMDFNTIPPADLINRIKKTPGVKQEELDDLGLLDWLAGVEGKVSKADVLDFIQKGGPQIEEVVKGAGGDTQEQWFIAYADGPTIGQAFASEDEALAELEDSFPGRDDVEVRRGERDRAEREAPTKFSQYQLPGGENYREVLLTVPVTISNISELDEVSQKWFNKPYSELNTDDKFLVDRNYAKPERKYRSSHWDEPNVLAHFRLNDRTNAEGKRTLFIEEIQSDWHQAGRKKGYGKSGVPDAPLKKTETWALLAFKRILRMAAEQGYDSVAWTPGEVQAERYDLSKQISLVEYREDMRRSVKNSGRRGELESLLYRVLEDAPRPDLPNIIARMSEKEVEDTILEYSNKPESQRYKNEAVGRLYAENLDGEQVIDERMPPEKVEDYVGKEVAERLFTSEPDKDGYRTLQGLDLKVGGEGMKGFYDKMLPKAVGKYVKKLDKDAKVGVTRIGAGDIDPETYDGPLPTESQINGEQQFWSLPITDKLREEVLKGQAMYQRPGARPSGANAMVNLKIATPKGNTIVTMFGTENESSFLHESGHIFFELLGFMARRPGAPQTATEDWQTVLDFVGNDGATPLTREQHEKLARSIEAYFLEGKAPSLRLRQVFQKFADWLKRIYADFAGLMEIAKQDITPTPEIVALMDRMFATDEEIAQAQNYYGQKDVYEAEAAKISEEEQAKYLAAVEEAQTEAKDNNMRRRMRAWAKVTGGRKRIEQQVRDEVNAEPVYALMDALRTEENGRLDLDSLSFAVGDEARKALSKKSLTKREGSDPYIRAARFGFASVDEMVTALLNAEKKSERIKAEVDKRMAEAMNELGRANTIEGMPVADQDVHTDAKLSVLFMELDMLRKQFAREEAAPERALRSLTVTAKRNAVKAAARRRLEGMKAKDARRYDTFSRAEAQASRESRAALEKGDYMAAEQAKLREIINHAMVIEAVKFREEMAAAEDMVAKAKSQKNMLADSRDLINDIAMRFGFHSAPQSRTAKMFEVYRAQLEAEGNLPDTLLAWADKMEEEGLTVFAPEWIDNAPPRPYQNLTVEQLRDVADAIRSVKTADRMQRIVITDEQGRTREQLIEDLKAAAAQNAKRKARPDRTDSRGRRLVNATHAWHIKMETVLLDLDGGKPGLFWETFYLPFEKAFNEEQTRLKAANEKINELFGRFNTKRQISMSTEKIRIEAIGKSLTKWQAIMAALNMGNEGNMNRLITGEKWSPEQAKAVLDVLEKDEVDFVQEVWEYFDSFREESFALERKLTGRAPKRVEPKPLETRHGVYAGGYFPIVNDPKLGIKAAYRELKDAATGGGSLKGTHHAAAATRRNHLKERTRGTGEKLLLDPSVISNHTFQVIHDLTHREAVQGVAQLSRDGKITDILQDYAGFDVTKAMSQWVVDIAAEQNGPQSPIHKFARWARTGTTLMSMGFKATTGVTQFVGYTSTIDQLKGWDKKYAAVGLATTYRNPSELPTLLRETFERSKFMAGRINSFDRDIRDATRRIGSNSVESKRLAKALGYADIAADKVAEFAFTHIGVAQMSVDLPTWWAMYAKVMDETNNEAQAVRAADSFVRQTQGGGATKDLARIQRGDDLMRLFTMFYSFFNTLYNMAYLSGRYVQKQGFTRGGVAAAAGSVMWLWFLPSLTAELVAGRGPDEDDGEGWAEWALPILALYPTQSIVGLRDAANAIGTKYDYAMTPAQAPVQSFDRWVGAVNKAWEEEDAILLVKPSVEAVGYLMHLPLGQAVITGQNLVDYATGEDPEFYLRDLLFKKPESRR